MSLVPGALAIAGMGVTEQGRRLGVPPRELRRVALERALDDAGITRREVDGYIGTSGAVFDDIRHLGLAPRFAWTMQAGGSTAIWSVLNAIGAILTGQAATVVCVYGAAPSSTDQASTDQATTDQATTDQATTDQASTDQAANPASPDPAVPPTNGGVTTGYGSFGYGYPRMYGMIGAAAAHAFHARRHMHNYGTTSRDLGAVAVTQRAYAARRPGTIGYGEPISIDDHQSSRMVVDPFRLLDCCRDTDGGVALVVTTTERARDLRAQPVLVLGLGTGHNIRNWWTGEVFDLHDDIAPAAITAFGQAGLTARDVDVASLYDPFTISPIMQLEAYGFCEPGEGGPFVSSGATGPGGLVPTNTGGGQLSGFYATGFTAVAEGVWQLRGEGGATQVADARVALVSGHGGNGGVQNTWSHATMLLGAA